MIYLANYVFKFNNYLDFFIRSNLLAKVLRVVFFISLILPIIYIAIVLKLMLMFNSQVPPHLAKKFFCYYLVIYINDV